MLLYFFTLQLLGYRILRWLFNFTISWLFNFTKFWRYKVTYYSESNQSRTVVSVPRPPARSGGIHSPLQRGEVGDGAVYFGCWRTGHGDHRPTLRVHLRPICYLCLPLYTFALARNTNNVCAHKTPHIM